MNNKNGQVIGLALVNIIIPFIAVMALILAFSFSTSLRWVLVGVACIAGGLWLISSVKSDKIKLTFGILLFGAAVILIFGSGLLQTAYTSSNLPTNIKLAIPHYGVYECVNYATATGLIYDLKTKTNGPYLLNGASTGLYTNAIRSIQLNVPYPGVSGYRKIVVQKCNKDGILCKPYIDETISHANNFARTLDNIDTKLYSYNISIYYALTGGLFGWDLTDAGRLVYDVPKYGLYYKSTTSNLAGEVICSNSCDLTCPQQKVSAKVETTQSNVLDFGKSAPAFEYWEDISYDLNTQAGAPIYDSVTNNFCLSNYIYPAKSYSFNGITYLYPDTPNRQLKQCCPGAVISTTTEDKYCQADFTWKTVTKDTTIKCLSASQCPGQGKNNCQNKILSYWSCDNSVCVDHSGDNVTCCYDEDCAVDQTCQNNKCVGGNVILPPVSPPGNGNETTCKWYESSYTKQNKDFGFMYWRALIGKPILTPETGCKTATWVNVLIISGMIFILAIVVITIWMPKKKKGKKRRI